MRSKMESAILSFSDCHILCRGGYRNWGSGTVQGGDILAENEAAMRRGCRGE